MPLSQLANNNDNMLSYLHLDGSSVQIQVLNFEMQEFYIFPHLIKDILGQKFIFQIFVCL